MTEFQPPSMPPPAPAPWAPSPGSSITPAPLGSRLGAYLLDAVLIIVTLVVGWLIWSIVLWSNGEGASPGKKIVGLRVVDAQSGVTVSGGTMALRELLGKWLLGSLSCGITSIVSAFMIIFNDRHTGIWDAIAGTIVVDRNWAPSTYPSASAPSAAVPPVYAPPPTPADAVSPAPSDFTPPPPPPMPG